MQPPVVARFVVARGTLGVLARLCAWPLLYTGAYAIAPHQPRFVAGALVLASLMASTVAASRSDRLARAGVVTAAIAVAIPTYAVARAAGWLGLGLGAIAGAAFAATLGATRVRDDAALDADARALAPAAVWIAVAAAATRFGAETVHLHHVVPAVGVAMGALATAIAVTALVVFVRQRRWSARVYAGREHPLRVTALPEDAAPAAPLSDVPGCTAAIVTVHGELGPYRAAGDRAVLARVPADAGPLLASHARALRRAALGAALGAAALVVDTSALPSRVHAEQARVALGALPGACTAARPTLHLVALEPLRAASIDVIADHYRAAGVVDVAPARSLLLEDRFIDTERVQLVAEDVAEAAREVVQPGAGDLVVVVTDHDMYLRSMEWQWAFAYRKHRVAVVSVARMDPAFPWLGPSTYRPERPECGADLHARVHKMLTRQILFAACDAAPVNDPRSARRASVLSLQDLDAIDERVY